MSCLQQAPLLLSSRADAVQEVKACHCHLEACWVMLTKGRNGEEERGHAPAEAPAGAGVDDGGVGGVGQRAGAVGAGARVGGCAAGAEARGATYRGRLFLARMDGSKRVSGPILKDSLMATKDIFAGYLLRQHCCDGSIRCHDLPANQSSVLSG